MKQSKREKLAFIDAELTGLIAAGKDVDKISYLCAAIIAITKGTKLELDGKSIVETACPKYFKELE